MTRPQVKTPLKTDMYWHEGKQRNAYVVPDDIVDLAFRISCRCLPLDHAYHLSQAICTALPWFEAEERAGIHLIHGAESGHGWQRPQDPAHDLLYLSRREKLTLRLPRERVADARRMSGATLQIGGYPMEVGDASVRPLSTWTTLFARYVIARKQDGEGRFLEQAAEQLMHMGVSVRKMLCGKSHVISTPAERIFARRLMVAELTTEDSITLQQRGLGPGRKLGCGLFIPHKAIAAVKAEDTE